MTSTTARAKGCELEFALERITVIYACRHLCNTMAPVTFDSPSRELNHVHKSLDSKQTASPGSLLRPILAAVLVLCTYWNLWIFAKRMGEAPPRATNVVVVQEDRYRGVRATLMQIGYQNGNIDFITNRTLKSEPYTDEDNQRWAEGQYAMVPWIVLREMRSVSGRTTGTADAFVVGDFWDAVPEQLPADLIRLYVSPDGLMLFKRRPLQ